MIAIEMAAEMIEGPPMATTPTLWRMAIAELDRGRAEIEADVLEHHGFAVPEHEWGAFLEYVGQVRGS